MKTMKAIQERRSIRRFKPDPIEPKMIEQLLELTTCSPSAKNEQPWRFVVVTGDAKGKLQEVMDAVCKKAQVKGQPTGSFPNSLRAMGEAPVLILVFNGLSRADLTEKQAYVKCLVDTQSIGAGIQTMLLAAQSMGLGTLWVCDVLRASEQIGSFVGSSDELVAAVAIGVPKESPAARPRRGWSEVTTFME